MLEAWDQINTETFVIKGRVYFYHKKYGQLTLWNCGLGLEHTRAEKSIRRSVINGEINRAHSLQSKRWKFRYKRRFQQ